MTITDARGFVAGTLVHTREGLVPIDKLKLGDMVLSQPEERGEIAFRPVIKTVSFENKDVTLLDYVLIDGKHENVAHLLATPKHLFFVKDGGWTSVKNLDPGCQIELRNGSAATFWRARKLFRTNTKDVGWCSASDEAWGPIVDLRDGSVVVGTERVPNHEFMSSDDPYLTRQVFNFEVEGFHTYYVGDFGVWVHNTQSPNVPAPFSLINR